MYPKLPFLWTWYEYSLRWLQRSLIWHFIILGYFWRILVRGAGAYFVSKVSCMCSNPLFYFMKFKPVCTEQIQWVPTVCFRFKFRALVFSCIRTGILILSTWSYISSGRLWFLKNVCYLKSEILRTFLQSQVPIDFITQPLRSSRHSQLYNKEELECILILHQGADCLAPTKYKT